MKTVRRFLPILLLLATACSFAACDDDDTYADMKEHERDAINSFLKRGACVMSDDGKDTLLYVAPIQWISEEQFAAQDSTTDLAKNEYVRLGGNGVYMQIIRKGSGEKIKHGETVRVLNRFVEYNIMGDSVQTTNYGVSYHEKMTVTNTYGSLTGSFIDGMMLSYYNLKNVPEGWLIPLKYINLCRIGADDVAKVRLIVPHSSGTTSASSSVRPYFYEVSYERGR